MGQKEKVLSYMEQFGGITSMDAFRIFAITRLSAVVKVLRDEGYRIDSVWERSKKGVRYTRYYLRAKR